MYEEDIYQSIQMTSLISFLRGNQCRLSLMKRLQTVGSLVTVVAVDTVGTVGTVGTACSNNFLGLILDTI